MTKYGGQSPRSKFLGRRLVPRPLPPWSTPMSQAYVTVTARVSRASTWSWKHLQLLFPPSINAQLCFDDDSLPQAVTNTYCTWWLTNDVFIYLSVVNISFYPLVKLHVFTGEQKDLRRRAVAVINRIQAAQYTEWQTVHGCWYKINQSISK